MESKSLRLRVGVDDVSGATRRQSGKKDKQEISALKGINDRRTQSGKWTFSSFMKNLFIAGRRERKEFQRTEVSSPFNVIHESDTDPNPLPVAFGIESRVFNNPLFNPHLDGSGEQRVHSETVKKAKGQHLLDALTKGGLASSVAVKQQQVRYHYGMNKSEQKSRDYIVASIGAEVARYFTASSSSALAAAVLDDIHQHGHSPARIPISDVISIDWTFSRDDEGAVTASYELNFKAPSGEQARARGSVDVNADGKLVRASRISVSAMSQALPGGVLAPGLKNIDNEL